MKVLGSRLKELVDDLVRVVRIHGRAPVIALDQADAPPSEKVDGWNYNHGN